jgi:hypothetical protein
MAKRVGDLEIDQDLTYQQREWKVQRTGWVVWVLLLLATSVGLLGHGPVSKTTAGSEGGPLWVEYYRFVRHRAPTTVLLHLDPALAREGIIRLELDQSYLEQVAIEDIVPKPDQEQAKGDRIVYSFAVAESEEPLVVTFKLEPDDPGSLSTAVAIEGGPAVNVRQFVYP